MVAGEAAAAPRPLVLIWGEDDYSAERRARDLFESWKSSNPSADAEVISGGAANVEEALKAVERLREALQTLPLFGGPKSVWLRGCNFLGEERVSEARAVTDTLAVLAQELVPFRWTDVRLLISAGKVDRRRGFFKAMEKGAEVEYFPGLDGDSDKAHEAAENLAAGQLRNMGKQIDADAL